MTERDPNELYDALRDRLADYGQEPPAHLWANIRQQLPPPVALPQHRPRRWAGRVLAGGLVSVACLSGWWWQQQLNTPSGTDAVAAAVRRISSATQPAGAPDRLKGNPKPAAANLATAATAAPDAAGVPLVTASLPGTDTALARATAPETATTSATAPVTAPAASAAMAALAMPATPEATTEPTTAARLAAFAATSSPHALAKTAHSTGARARTGRPVGEPVARRHRRAVLIAAAPSSHTSTIYSRAAFPASGEVAGTQPGAGAHPAAGATSKAGRATGQATRASRSADTLLTASLLTADAARNYAVHAGHAEETPLLLRPVALPPVAGPGRDLVAVTKPVVPLPLVAAQRWSLQVLAGPSLTYRRVGTALESAAAPSNAALYDRHGAATSLVALERPAAGFGAQVELRRVLTGRWALSSGLGYQEYATRLDLRTVQATVRNAASGPFVSALPAADSTATTVRLRDTYRFLTVPVRFSYQLEAGSPRFRYGVLGGAELAVYIGGRTTEGNNCACQTATEDRPLNPYRPLSLALNLGLDLRYRLAPGWELLAQPTATYFVSSLARPASGFAPRHLLGAGVQVGVAYGLH